MYQKKILFISLLFLTIILTGCNKQTTAVEAVKYANTPDFLPDT